MVYSFHPFPLASMIKIAILIVILCVVLIAVRDYAGSLFLPLLALLVIIGVLKILYSLLMANGITLSLDDTAVTYSVGLFSRKEYLIPYSKITESSFSQGILERILGQGTLNIVTPGAVVDIHLSDVRFKDIQYTLNKIQSVDK